MKKISFHSSWLFKRLDEKQTMTSITLPHDAMIYETRDQSHPSGKHGCYLKGYDYQYQKSFVVELSEKESHIIFEFEGVYHQAEVYVNDEKLMIRAYGYTNFYVDVTKAIRFGGENTITVIARNAAQPNSRWYSGAGIYRPVYMYILPKKHIELNGIKVTTIDDLVPTIAVDIKTNEPGNIQLDILDDDQLLFSMSFATDGHIQKQVILENATLWSPEQPKLYTCRARFEEDVHSVEFGIRKITFNTQDGLCINGKRVILKGGCIHHDNGLLGAMNHPYADARKIAILKKAGFNAIRSAHNPISKASLDACDRLGMLVMDEYVDMWYIHKTRYDYASEMVEHYEQDLLDLVNKDYNHPSVIMYSIGNEVAETSETRGISLTKTMTDYLHGLDATRPVTCGINVFFNFLYSLGFGVYSDDKADKGEEVGSEFFNKLAGMFGDKTMKIGASLHGSDRATKKAFSHLDIAGYNYGILRYKKDMKKYPNRLIVGSETFGKDAYRFYELAKKHPALIGDFMWAAQDYLGEVAIGSWEYKAYAKDFKPVVGWMSAGSGRIDLTGKPLCEMSYVRVAYELDTIRIGVVPVAYYGEAHSPSAWKMSNAIESWSWAGFEGQMTKVEVYGRGHHVKLFLNDKKIGEKKNRHNCYLSFKVKYYPGLLKAISYTKDGQVIGTTQIQTAKPITILRAIPEVAEVSQNELLYVRYQYSDDEGIIQPLARGKITLDIEGGELLAFGHACPFNDEGYHQTYSDTYYGEALAIIRPLDKEHILISATSEYGNVKTMIPIKNI